MKHQTPNERKAFYEGIVEFTMAACLYFAAVPIANQIGGWAGLGVFVFYYGMWFQWRSLLFSKSKWSYTVLCIFAVPAMLNVLLSCFVAFDFIVNGQNIFDKPNDLGGYNMIPYHLCSLLCVALLAGMLFGITTNLGSKPSEAGET